MTLLTREEIAELLLAEAAARPCRGSGRRTSGPPARPAARAVAALQPGSVDAERQLRLVMAYLDAHAYLLVGLVRWPATPAVDMIRAGEADLVVAALQVRSGGVTAIEADVAELGGRVVYVREPRRIRREADDLAARMLAKGLDPALVAELLEVPEETVRVLVADRGRRAVRR